MSQLKIYDADKLIKQERAINFKGFAYKFTKIPVYYQLRLLELASLAKEGEKGDMEAMAKYIDQVSEILASFLSGCGKEVKKEFLLKNMDVETVIEIASWIMGGAKSGQDRIEEAEKKSEEVPQQL